MVRMMMLTWPLPQVVTDPRKDKEETSTVGGTEVICLMDRPELALPRFTNVCPVTVGIFDANAADIYEKHIKQVYTGGSSDDTM